MPSFDIVSELSVSGLQNAIENSRRELTTRWDFRGVESDIHWKKDDKEIVLSSSSSMHVQQLLAMLTAQFVKQGLGVNSLEIPAEEKLSGKNYFLSLGLKSGIPKELLQKLNQFVKKNFSKAQSQMQNEQLRVQAKSRDVLQAVIQAVQAENWERPFQFVNFKD